MTHTRDCILCCNSLIIYVMLCEILLATDRVEPFTLRAQILPGGLVTFSDEEKVGICLEYTEPR
jgi:hypothetical protein